MTLTFSTFLNFSSVSPPPPPLPGDPLIPLLPIPAEFFLPAISTGDKDQGDLALQKSLPKLYSPEPWTTLHSPDVKCSLHRQVRLLYFKL